MAPSFPEALPNGLPAAAAPLRLLGVRGLGGAASVITAETADGHRLELAEGCEPGPSGARRVFSISTSLGCPVRCAFCDAGGHYEGRLTAAEILAQVDVLLCRGGRAARDPRSS